MILPWEIDNDAVPTSQEGSSAHLSGVHDAPTQPAPYVEELGDADVGSIPAREVYAAFEPIVELDSGRTEGFEVHARCRVEGLQQPEELLARAAFEQRLGQLGRLVRQRALDVCGGHPIFVRVQSDELRDGFLIRPDEPIYSHDADVYVSVAQPTFSGTCRQVLQEVCQRPGMGLVLDNFGAGVTSFADAIALAPAMIKLDPILVRDIDRSQRKRDALAGLVRMMGDLGARVVAKDICGLSELRAVRSCGVQLAQGPLFGRIAELPTISSYRAR